MLVLQNGLLALVYSVAESRLLAHTSGAMFKAVAALVSPVLILAMEPALFNAGLLGRTEQIDFFPGWMTCFGMSLAGAVAFVIKPTYFMGTSKEQSSENKNSCASDHQSSLPTTTAVVDQVHRSTLLGVPLAFTTITACYAAWNIVQRTSTVEFAVNSLEWTFLDKAVGSAWFLVAHIVNHRHPQSWIATWCVAMKQTLAGLAWVMAFLFLQVARLRLTFLLIGNPSTPLAAASFMTTTVRVAAVGIVSMLVAGLIPWFINLSTRDVNWHFSRPAIAFKITGFAAVASSVVLWRIALLNPHVIGHVSFSPSPSSLQTHSLSFLATGDWGSSCVTLNDTVDPSCGQASVAAGMAMYSSNRSSRPAFVLNLGDSFYDASGHGGGVSSMADLDRRAAAHQRIHSNSWVGTVPWYSVRGNHDLYGNAAVLKGVHSLLRYVPPHFTWSEDIPNGGT